MVVTAPAPRTAVIPPLNLQIVALITPLLAVVTTKRTAGIVRVAMITLAKVVTTTRTAGIVSLHIVALAKVVTTKRTAGIINL